MTTTDPFALFDAWYAEAHASEINDSNAMTLATVDGRGQPSARMVLLKGHGPDGFVFYTNFEGRKADDLLHNPWAALLFHWKSLRRQVRIEGPVDGVDDAVADAYFASRSRDSQLGAWASDQSRPLPDRDTFLSRFEEMAARFKGWPGAAPAALVGVSGQGRTDRIPGRIAPFVSTNGRCSCPMERAAGKAASSIHDNRPWRSQQPCGNGERGGGSVSGDAQKLCGVADRVDRDARVAGRYGPRPHRQPRHPCSA